MAGNETIKYSLKNIAQRKSRSFLTIFSIFIGISTIFIFVSFGLGLYSYVGDLSSASSADKIIVQSKAGFGGMDDTFGMSDKEVDIVERTSGVFDATGTYFKAVGVTSHDEVRYTFLTGYDPKKPLLMDILGIGIEQGRMLKGNDKGKVLMGHNYLIKNKIFPRALGLNDKVEIKGESFKIIGFLEEVGSSQDDAQVYITLDSYEDLYQGEELSYNWIVAQAELDSMDEVISKVEKNLRKERDQKEGKEDFFVQSFQDYIEGFSTALNIIIGFVFLIAFISVIVSTINTANTMITSVIERIKEIGVIKSLGARNKEVFLIFLFESSFLGFIAGVVGVLVGWALSTLGGAILQNIGYGFLQPLFSPWLFVGCIVFSTLTGAISGALPARQASKTNIVDALRYE